MAQPDRSPARILVVEDDDAIAFGLRTNLIFEGFEVELVGTRERAISTALEQDPDLIVLDLMLPDGSGFEVIDALRREKYEGLILVLSARKEETDKVSALRLGADDYVTKPFSLAELIARVGALLRRGSSQGRGRSATVETEEFARASLVAPRVASDRVRFGRCELDLGARTLRVDAEPVILTRLEFDLLLYLTQNAGRALTRGQLLRDVWGVPHDGSARTVDNVVAHLRTKIGEDAESPHHLLTLRGAGYRFELESESSPPPAAAPGSSAKRVGR